jgi:hypothetical protein
MLSSGSGGQPKGVGRRVQAGCGLESGTSGLRCRHFASLCVLTLAGCSSFPSSMNPVSWWHGLQGGKIAEERPPPPGADQPYPNLASVPPKPAQPDRAALDNIARPHQRATRGGGGADDRPVCAQRIARPVRARHRAAAPASVATWGREGECHHGGSRGAASPGCAARSTKCRRSDGGSAGQGAGRCGADHAACAARCRGAAALRPSRGSTSIASRSSGTAQPARRSTSHGIVGSCWRLIVTWPRMESRAASARHCHEGCCDNADVATSGQAARLSQRRQRDVCHRLR